MKRFYFVDRFAVSNAPYETTAPELKAVPRQRGRNLEPRIIEIRGSARDGAFIRGTCIAASVLIELMTRT